MATNKRPRSAVWDYYSKDDVYATCLLAGCNTKIKHCSNTSNLLKHLFAKHQKEYQACIQARESAEAASKKKKDDTHQVTLQTSFLMGTPYPRESNRCRRLDDALIEMIAVDLQPPSIVNDKGFVKFVSILDSRYQLPSRRTIMIDRKVSKYQEECYCKVKTNNQCIPDY